jgi:hypothetical protein
MLVGVRGGLTLYGRWPIAYLKLFKLLELFKLKPGWKAVGDS